jgi:LmbE family N-acetylglucosaminyl deacetylase
VTRPILDGVGTVLGVWAHPDDEAYLSAGLMALARGAGQRVVVVTATAGEAGAVDGRLRRREMAESLAVVGVTEHHWLGFADGGCADVDTDAGAAAVHLLLQHVRPDTILTFGSDGVTGHPDHVAVGRWVRQAWQQEGCRAALLTATLTESFHEQWGALAASHGVWMPGAVPPRVPDDEADLRLLLGDVLSCRKLAALRAHASQTDGLRDAVGDETFRRWWAEEAFVRVTPPAELAA